MPLLVAPVPREPPPDGQPPFTPVVEVTWTPPDAEPLDLTDEPNGLQIAPGVDGFGAAPRTITRQPKAAGGAFARYSYANERLLIVPIAVMAETSAQFLARRRLLTLAFTSTAPAAGEPRLGLLRVIRADATWREIACIYVDGLGWTDDSGRGRLHDVAVVQLVAPDPWWYGPQIVVLRFEPSVARNYLSPYETVSPDRSIGTQLVHIDGDAPVSPVWTLHGPADGVSVSLRGGPGFTFGAIDPGQTITVDVAASTVSDNDGRNRIGDLGWPGSSLFELPPGDNELVLSLTGGIPGASAIELAHRPRYETV